ncbi:MAG: rod shape-determining protein MreC [Fusobacteriaceae bacterium]|nr:rod shape-determining protein MreC [Fusobacteriaceae bacterium]MBN2838618.1 rod shape-determining protein MreC [Fusobacteriaceae bacterium]
MNFREKKKKRNLYMIIIGTILFIFFAKTQLNYIRGGLNKLFIPIKSLVYKGTGKTKNAIKNIRDIERILKENERLKKENFKLKIDKKYVEDLKVENQRLKTILDLKQTAEREFIVANVSFKDALSVYNEFVIDKGSEDGIRVGLAVVKDEILVGRIKEVTKNNSIVELISKSGKYTSVVVGNNKHLAILKGNNSNTLTVENIETDALIKNGDKIYTSGIGDLYPKDFYIGQITKVQKKKEDLFQDIELRLPYNIFEVTQVMVLK